MKNKFGILAIVFCALPSAAFALDPAPQENSVQTLVGYSIVPSAIYHSDKGFSDQDYLNLNIDNSAFTTFEGNIWHTKTGLKLGISADIDNNAVGKVNKVAGLLGYKKLMLRIQKSKLGGTAIWRGPVVAGQPSEIRFENVYNSVDLLYREPGRFFDYLGVGYITMSLPLQFDTVYYNGAKTTNGNPAYEDKMDFKIYAVMVGFDTMTDAATNRTPGPGLWLASQDRLGFGTTKISREAKRRLEAANPGRTLKNNSFTAVDIDIDMTLGLFWNFKIKQAFLSFGAGYNVSGMLLGELPHGLKENNMYASPESMLYRTGTVFRALLYW